MAELPTSFDDFKTSVIDGLGEYQYIIIEIENEITG